MAKSKLVTGFLLLSAFMLILTTCGGAAGTAPVEFFTVSFFADGGEPEPEAQLIQKGGLITLPEEMTKSGSKFDNWYKDEDCAELWDFENDIVIEDITLFAKWNPASGGGGGGGGRSTPAVPAVPGIASGTTLWAKTIMAGTGSAVFIAVAADQAGNVYAAGLQYETGNYNYGSGNVAGKSTLNNPVLVKYSK